MGSSDNERILDVISMRARIFMSCFGGKCFKIRFSGSSFVLTVHVLDLTHMSSIK